jgi:hypothetical protein
MPNLDAGERVLKTGPVVWVTPQGGRSGVLSITDRAMIFEGPVPPPDPNRRPGAPRPPGPVTLVQGQMRIGFWRCRNASVSGGAGGGMLDLELLRRHIFFQVADAPSWAAVINEARLHAPPGPPGAMGGPGGSRQPRCEFCGNLSPAGSTRCESCGAPF